MIGRASALALFALTPACGPGAGGDTGAEPAEERPAWTEQPWYRSLLLPADAGLAFELDESFLLDGYTVPTILVDADGQYRLLATDMDNHGVVTALRSPDALSWDDPQAVLTPDDFAGACGVSLVDSAVVYLDDGSYRLVVEGALEAGGSRRVFCSAISADAETWTPESVVWEGTDNDYGTVSVPEVLRVADGRWLLYYLGDMASGGGPEQGDAPRIAASEDGATFTSLVDTNILAPHDTDPFPVLLDDGRYRLYHTHPVWTGRLGCAESDDAVSFGPSVYLDGLGDTVVSAERWLDPVALALPDGRVVLYFTRFEQDETGTVTLAAIGRAWAVDLPSSR